MNTPPKQNNGFTLIELLVVIAIIGILAAIILSALGSTRVRAKDAVVVSALSNYRSEAQLIFEDGFTSLCSSQSLAEVQSYIEDQGGVLESCNDGVDEYRIVIGLPSSFVHNTTPTVYAAGEDGFCINSKGDAVRVDVSVATSLPSPLCVEKNGTESSTGGATSSYYSYTCSAACSGGKCSTGSLQPTCIETTPTMTGKGLINMKQSVPKSFCSSLPTPNCSAK